MEGVGERRGGGSKSRQSAESGQIRVQVHGGGEQSH